MSYIRDPLAPFNPVNAVAPAAAKPNAAPATPATASAPIASALGPGDAAIVERLPAILDAVRILSPAAGTLAHGEEHWRRVATLGLNIAEANGADRLLVVLFAMFHDAMRFNLGKDDDHGMRGGFLAACMNAELLGLDEERLDKLDMVCRDHSIGSTSEDPTIGACWDADRVDLIRFDRAVEGIYMSTLAAREVWFQRHARTLLTGTPDWEQIFYRLAH